MENGQQMDVNVSDTVGGNAASEEFAAKHKGMTLPDGEYTVSGKGLIPQEDGTFDSNSYKNALRYQTNDESISENTRTKINKGFYLFHATENKAGKSWNKAWSAGCTSPPGGQKGQNSFMDQLPRSKTVTYNVTIFSESNKIPHNVMR